MVCVAWFSWFIQPQVGWVSSPPLSCCVSLFSFAGSAGPTRRPSCAEDPPGKVARAHPQGRPRQDLRDARQQQPPKRPNQSPGEWRYFMSTAVFFDKTHERPGGARVHRIPSAAWVRGATACCTDALSFRDLLSLLSTRQKRCCWMDARGSFLLVLRGRMERAKIV